MFQLNGQKIRIDVDLTIGEGDDAITIPALHLQDPVLRADYGIVEATTAAGPRPDERYYWVSDHGDGTYSSEPKDLDILRKLKLDEIAAMRWSREVGGIDVGGVQIKTDRESQAQLSSAFASLTGGLIPDTPWKAVEGWVRVTLDDIRPIAGAVAVHVRSCFDWEERAQGVLDKLIADTRESGGDVAEAVIGFTPPAIP